MDWMMKKFNMKTDLLLLVSVIIFCGCQSNGEKSSRVDRLPYYNEATFTPLWLNEGDKALEKLHRISPFKLFNQEGKTITEKDFEGKIYVTNFFFTFCPGICPQMMANMMDLQEEFLEDEDILLLSHSVTPERDSIPVLKAYAENKGILSQNWHLVTGKQEDIYKLGRKDYFVEEDLGIEKDIDEFLHTENLVLIDKNAHIRGIYNGLDKNSIKQLVADIKTLKKE